MLQGAFNLTGKNIDFCDTVYFIAEKFYTDGSIGTGNRENFYYVAPDAESASFEVHVVAGVLYFYQTL